MNVDLYDAAKPARDAMAMELVRICAGRDLAKGERAGQQLANHLSCVVAAFNANAGIPQGEIIHAVHIALGILLHSVASNLKVARPGVDPSVKESLLVTLAQTASRARLSADMQECGLADSVVPLKPDAQGRMEPRPFDFASMMKGPQS